MGTGLVEHARGMRGELPPHPSEPGAQIMPQDIVDLTRRVASHDVPRLAPDDGTEPSATVDPGVVAR
jgi:hypothetical protein